MAWFAYVLQSPRGRTYVGTSTDVARRLRQHNGELTGGARSTRAGRPWSLARVVGPYDGRGDALRAEVALRRLRGPRRLSAEVVIRRAPVDDAVIAVIAGNASGDPG